MPARSITRTVSVVERLLLLASVVRDEAGAIWLRPPPGGYVISTLELDDAMRLLGGPHRRVLLAGYGLLGLGLVAALVAAHPVPHRRLARTSVRGHIGTNGAYGPLPCHFYHPFTGS